MLTDCDVLTAHLTRAHCGFLLLATLTDGRVRDGTYLQVYVATAVMMVLTPAACLRGMWPSYLSHSLYTGNYDTLFVTLHPPLSPAFRDVGKNREKGERERERGG